MSPRRPPGLRPAVTAPARTWEIPKEPPPRVSSFTLPEVAFELRCSVRKVQEMVALGELTSFKVGRSSRVSRVALEEFQSREYTA
jgi:excisionase family DNA binding protein